MSLNNSREKRLFHVSNPAFNERAYAGVPVATTGEAATVNGAVQKTGILLILTILFACLGWASATQSFGLPTAIGCLVASIVLGFVIGFGPAKAPALAPIYAVANGFWLGVASFVINEVTLRNSRGEEGVAQMIFRNAVPTAIGGTLLVTGVMLALYRAKIIRATKTFQAVVLGATVTVAGLYLVTFLGGFIWPALRQLPIYQASPIGIGFSVLVIALAAMNLILDFHWMDAAEENRLPKYMEWYTGWGLMVTIVWIYIEILRLISKIAGNRN